MKQTIRLTESELRNMIAESVKRVLNESVNMDSPLYWKNTCLQYIKAIEQEVSNDNWENVPSVGDSLQMCYDYYKQTIQNYQQPQQMQQQPTQQQPQLQQQPTQQPKNTNNNTMINNQVQQQMQRNMGLQQKMANKIRQQKMAKFN